MSIHARWRCPSHCITLSFQALMRDLIEKRSGTRFPINKFFHQSKLAPMAASAPKKLRKSSSLNGLASIQDDIWADSSDGMGKMQTDSRSVRANCKIEGREWSGKFKY